MAFKKGAKATGGIIISRNRGSLLFRLAGLQAQARSLESTLSELNWLMELGIDGSDQYLLMQGHLEVLREITRMLESVDADLRRTLNVKSKL